MDHPTVLVFVEFPNPKVPTTGFLDHFKYPDAELAGFYQLDEDESIEAARSEYEDKFTTELQEIAETFEERGVRTEYDIVFSHDRDSARQQIAQSDGIDATLLPGAANTLGKILVASRDLRNAEDKVSLLSIVDPDDLIAIDLIHIADPDDPDGTETGEQILRETTSVLTGEGFPELRINQEVRTGTDVAWELSQAARGYDLVVLGETERDIGDKIFGPVGRYIVDRQDVPVLIVR